jgi:MauM/NapG family ferredoxin protein
MKPMYWRRARQAAQALSLLLFVAIVLYTLRGAGAPLRADALMRLDPLAGAAAMLSARRWLAAFVPAVVLVVATLALGRFWCGWLCPLGTLIDWTAPRRHGKPDPDSRWRSLKYVLLFATLLAAFWGSLTLLALDPLTIVIRTMSTVALPALGWLVSQAQVWMYRIAPLRGVADGMDGLLRGVVLHYPQPHYAGGLLLMGLFAGILLLNHVARRAWCRYLCPLGAMLGLLSKVSWLKRRVGAGCVNCGVCARECRMGTIDPARGYASDGGECIMCMDCLTDCARDGNTFRGAWGVDRGWPYDPGRRHALGALGLAAGGLAVARVSPAAHHPHPHRLRPPGARERDLLAACVRCGACVRVCPTHGLQHAVAEAGLEGFWTPVLAPRLGYCDYGCAECGHVCPTGAIPMLDLEAKRQAVIGKAMIDPSLCIAWSGRGPCIVCEEMCPVPNKAIVLDERTFADSEWGGEMMVQVPVVVQHRCIGCGICENRCPVRGESAIRVVVDPLSF